MGSVRVTTSATIREATPDDLADVQRLLHEYSERALETIPGRRYMLVLDAPDGGGLAAAALVHIERARGQLALLVVAPRFAGQGIEERMIGVAEALCEAYAA
jgi:N-acetylglutamate synthase-like GNAT family acetyltransferase